MNENDVLEAFGVDYQKPVADVRVINFEEMAVPANEKAAGTNHVVTMTYTDIGVIIPILNQDPNRLKSEVFISGVGMVFICHSESSAQAALTGTGGNFGAAITCPGANTGSIRYTDSTQAKQWAVLTGASPVLSIITERKDA